MVVPPFVISARIIVIVVEVVVQADRPWASVPDD